MKKKTPVSVHLISPSGLTVESLAAVLEEDEELALRGRSTNIEDACTSLFGTGVAVAGDVDVVLIDAARGEWALEIVRRLAEKKPCFKLLPFGIDNVHGAVEFLEAGAGGYSMRTDSLAAMRRTIRAVAAGEPPCAPRVTALIYARIVELSRRATSGGATLAGTPGEADLSRRERQVLDLLAHGRRNKEIAHDLGIALSTAGKHVQRVLKKLEVNRRRDAIRRAYEYGILDGAPPFVAA